MAVTLAERAKTMKEPLRKGIVQNIVMESNLMETIPWEDSKSLNAIVTRWQGLPSVGFRRLNEAYTESTGTTEQVSEQLAILGGDINIDVVLLKEKDHIIDPRQNQILMKSKSIAYTFNDYFINGDPVTDPKGFKGINYRIVNELPATQIIEAAANGLDVDADSASKLTFLNKLEELIYAVGGHLPDALLMNKNTLLKLAQIIREVSYTPLGEAQDLFGRPLRTFGGIKIYDMGVKADQTTMIMPNSEVQGSSGAVCTSIYAVRFGVGDYLCGLQLNDLETRVLGEQGDKPVDLIRIEWPVGLAAWVNLWGARLRGLITT